MSYNMQLKIRSLLNYLGGLLCLGLSVVLSTVIVQGNTRTPGIVVILLFLLISTILSFAIRLIVNGIKLQMYERNSDV